jgi:hypothetical protein
VTQSSAERSRQAHGCWGSLLILGDQASVVVSVTEGCARVRGACVAGLGPEVQAVAGQAAAIGGWAFACS